MDIVISVALATGANRGIGREIVRAPDTAGAKRIYAAARDPAQAADLADDRRITPLALDITDPAAGLIMTHGGRAELAGRGTQVLAVLPGPLDTDMTPGGESKPGDIAAAIIDPIRDDAEGPWTGPMAETIRDGLAGDEKALEKRFAAMLSR